MLIRKVMPIMFLLILLAGCAGMKNPLIAPTPLDALDDAALTIKHTANQTKDYLRLGKITPDQAQVVHTITSELAMEVKKAKAKLEAGDTEGALSIYDLIKPRLLTLTNELIDRQLEKELIKNE